MLCVGGCDGNTGDAGGEKEAGGVKIYLVLAGKLPK